MLITGMNFRNVVDNLSNFPGISPWLGSREDFTEILASSNAAQVVGGQKRRLGRFLFACEAAEFRDRIRSFVNDMTHNSPNGQRSSQVTFHVCCGLAGGTGSGSVIDSIAQIRASFPEAKDRIILYLMLPERLPAPASAWNVMCACGKRLAVTANGMPMSPLSRSIPAVEPKPKTRM